MRTTINQHAEKIAQIVRSVKAKKGYDIADLRKQALYEAGYICSGVYNKWGFGKVGSVKISKIGVIEAQLKYAKAKKLKTGITKNLCPVCTVEFLNQTMA